MFNDLKKWRTVVFIDLSNIFYMQYTLWRKFETKKFLNELDKDKLIAKTCLFWAYSEDKQSQVDWVNWLMESFWEKDNFLIEFKKLRLKWWKHKWNMDTEIIFEASTKKDTFDTMILFSWDWDFAHLSKKMIEEDKNIFIFSTSSHVWVELYELDREINNSDKFHIYDINSDSDKITMFLKQIIRWPLFLYPELMNYYKSISKDELQKNIDLMEWLIAWDLSKNQRLFETDPNNGFLNNLYGLKTKNNEFIYPVIKKWKKQDKERLVFFLKSLL